VDFADLYLSGNFTQHAYSNEEQDDAQFSHLHRLVFTFNGRDQGRLRELVDFINQRENRAEAQPASPATQRVREPLKVT